MNFKTFLAESELSDRYQKYFSKKLKEYNVSSPAELEEEDMKKFFNDVSDGWIKGKGEK